MKIVVVGATGNVGSRVVDEALGSGHQVVAYARRPEAIRNRAGLSVVKGELADVAALADAAAGAEAVIVSITGSMKGTTFMQRSLPQVIEAMKRAPGARLVLVSAFGAGDTAAKASWFMKLAYRVVLGKFFADKAAADKLLASSGIEYTIVYPVNLKDAPALGRATVLPLEHVAAVPGMPTLPFPDAARALVEIAADPSSAGARVLVTTPSGFRPIR